MKVDLVFEGGGVKGIAFVGAVCCLEDNNYKIGRCAGTSAGAVVAALLAVGYTGRELKDIMLNTDYSKYLSKKSKARLPLIDSFCSINEKLRRLYSLVAKKGLYSNDMVEEILTTLLQKKGKLKFKDVYKNGESNLKIIASDITKRDMLILPEGLKYYGIDPLEFEIAKAVKMSTAIPFCFEPVKLKHKNGVNYIVDGGLVSNFPIWIFDVKGIPRWPTFGFDLVSDEKSYTAMGKKDLVSFSLDTIGTMINRKEYIYVNDKDAVRSIKIPTLGVKSTDFNIEKEKVLKLYNQGYKSTENFLKAWNFNDYLRKFRT